jgi:single-strand DNA-binding protein
MFDPTISLAGNVGQEPVFRMTSTNVPVCDLRVAVTPRRKDRTTGEWGDDPTLWFKVTAWRQLGEHVAQSVKKGDRVVVTGVLGLEQWKTEVGEERQGLAITASTVGLDLSKGTATYLKAPRLDVANPPPDGVDDDGVMSDELVEAYAEEEERAA